MSDTDVGKNPPPVGQSNWQRRVGSHIAPLLAGQRTAILVAGMHRSGTSALTRLLSLLGCDLPRTLMPPRLGNEAGHWESEAIADLNDEILAAAGSAWDDWQALDPVWYETTAAIVLRRRAEEVMAAEFGASSLFVLKDPRLARMMPFWIATSRGAGAVPHVLVPIRNPLEVAASLSGRNSFDPGLGQLLWLRHVLDAEAGSRDMPRVFVRYDDVLLDWRMTARRIGEALAVTWPRLPEEMAGEIDSFLAPSLRHYVADDASVLGSESLAQWIRASFAIFDRWCRDRTAAADLDELDRIKAAFDEAAPAFAPTIEAGREAARKVHALDNEIAAARGRAAEHKGALAERDGRIDKLDRALAERDVALAARDAILAERNASVSRLGSVLDEREATVARLEAMLLARDAALASAEEARAERDAALAAQRALLDQREAGTTALASTVAQRDAEIRETAARLAALAADAAALREVVATLHGSTSWRITAPLRALKTMFAPSANLGAAIAYTRPIFPIMLGIRALRARSRAPLRDWHAVRMISRSDLFDRTWYLQAYPDVAARRIDPVVHYVAFGAREGRDPSPRFSTSAYLFHNPDVAAADRNPLWHFLRSGFAEGRRFDLASIPASPYVNVGARMTGPIADKPERPATPVRTDHARIRTPKSLVLERFPYLEPLPTFRVPGQTALRINMVTDSINAGSLFGGVATAIVVSALLAKALKAQLRIVTLTEPPCRENVSRILACNGIQWQGNIEFHKADIKAHALPCGISDRDVFLTTSWWSTVNVRRATHNQRIIYLLQEDERMFYPAGDEQLRCSETMADASLEMVINSKLLYDHLSESGFENIHRNGLWFEPAFPEKSYYFEKTARNRRQFIFYARPNNVRNLYYRGVEAINTALREGVFEPAEWEFIFLGRDLQDVQLERNITPRLLQNLPWDKYASVIRGTDLGLCLMYTPHPSYPPLDLVASGGVAVTNGFGLKRSLEKYSKNLVTVECDVASLVNGLRRGVALACDAPRRLRHYEEMTIERQWDNALRQVVTKLVERTANV